MAVTIKPKRFGPVIVRFDGAGTVGFATSPEGPFEAFPPYDKPVSTVLASVGHCLVESLRIVATQQSLGLGAFSITVTATKAIDLPSRLATIECLVTGDVQPEDAAAAELVKTAKTICTISNSLNSDITVRYVPQDGRPGQ